MKAAILTIGDELLIGQTVDTNASHIAGELNKIGLEIIGKRTVGDDKGQIIKALNELKPDADIIITTGGLGPTKDDITKDVIGEYLNRPMSFNQEIFDLIEGFFKRIGRKTSEAHRLQAYMPQGVELLSNKMGTAPGMWFEQDQKYYCNLPGVPYEMKFLLSDQVIPKINTFFNPQIIHRTLKTAGTGETKLADLIHEIEEALPDHFSIAYLPDLGTVRIRLTGKGKPIKILEQEIEPWFNKIDLALADYVFGYEEETISSALGRILKKSELKIGTAESCTGGKIAHQIVVSPGASSYYEGSIIAYSYESKIRQLNVNEKTLTNFGAVSEETVREMLAGLLDKMNINVGIAVSGIAGPEGGIPDKPVGTIWIAYGSKEKIKTKRIQATKYRDLNIRYTSNVAINLMIKFLLTNK